MRFISPKSRGVGEWVRRGDKGGLVASSCIVRHYCEVSCGEGKWRGKNGARLVNSEFKDADDHHMLLGLQDTFHFRIIKQHNLSNYPLKQVGRVDETSESSHKTSSKRHLGMHERLSSSRERLCPFTSLPPKATSTPPRGRQ